MTRRILQTALLLLIAVIAFGQVRLRLPDTTAAPGSSIVLPITVQGFKNVGSISLTVSFDNKVLVYEGVSNQPKFGYFNATPAAHANNRGAVSLSWFNVTPSLTILNGKLLDLNFKYKNGTSPLTFANMVPSSVTDSLARNLAATVKNGKVSARALQSDTKSQKRPSGVK